MQFALTEEAFAKAVRRGQEVALGDAVTHIKEAIAEGRIRDAEPEALAHAVLGLTGHLAREYRASAGRRPRRGRRPHRRPLCSTACGLVALGVVLGAQDRCAQFPG